MNSSSESENVAPRNQIESQVTVQRGAFSASQTRKEPCANLRNGAVHGGDAAPQKCFVCNKEIGDDRPFCRILRAEKPAVVLCCPRCALGYLDTLHPPMNGDELDRAAYERSLRFLVDGEKP